MLSNLALLYVEDDPLSRESLDLVLRRVMGLHDVWLFADSSDFRNRLKALPRRPDLVLLDINVKPHNGLALLAMLRDDPDFQDVVVLAVTASVMSEQVDLLRQNGFNGAIGKPIDVATFPALIERAMRGEAVWSIAA